MTKTRKLNVAFFGNNALILEEVIKYSHVSAIFSRKDSGKNENIKLIKTISIRESIPFFQLSKKELCNEIQRIRKFNLDLIVVCGYKYIIPPEIYNIPNFKSINIHPSYLPLYRGQHVINWALINNEKYSGVTIHYLDSGIDTGDIVIQKKVPIYPYDNAKTLSDKIYVAAVDLVKKVLINFSIDSDITITKQNENKATYFKPRTPEDGKIDWKKNGFEIYNQIRALVKPWPGAFSHIGNQKIIFYNANFKKCDSVEKIGTITDVYDSVLEIAVNGGKLVVTDYEVIVNQKYIDVFEIKCKMRFNID